MFSLHPAAAVSDVSVIHTDISELMMIMMINIMVIVCVSVSVQVSQPSGSDH